MLFEIWCHVEQGAKLFDSLLVGPVLRTYTQYSTSVSSRPEVAGQVIYNMWPTVPDKCPITNPITRQCKILLCLQPFVNHFWPGRALGRAVLASL